MDGQVSQYAAIQVAAQKKEKKTKQKKKEEKEEGGRPEVNAILALVRELVATHSRGHAASNLRTVLQSSALLVCMEEKKKGANKSW